MIELKAKARDACVADTVLASMLAFVPGTTRRAVYINHLSQYAHVNYPAVSFFLDSGGSDMEVLCAEDCAFQVDVWCKDEPALSPPNPPGLEYGLTGAWRIWRRLKHILHMAHLAPGRPLANDAAYSLQFFVEVPNSVGELFDPEQKLFNLSGRYHARLTPAGAEVSVPN